jgi:hypothetical protein
MNNETPGYVRDTMGLENLFSRKDDLYSVEDFEHYGSVIMKLKVHDSSTANN